MGSRNLCCQTIKETSRWRVVVTEDQWWLVTVDGDDDLRSQTIRNPPPYLTPLVEEVKETWKDIQCLFQITEKTKVSPGLYRQLRETFQCHICRSTPIAPPVTFARYCRRILGCQTCVDAWYGGEEGMSRTFPMCCFERAYSETTTLRGLDDFLSHLY